MSKKAKAKQTFLPDGAGGSLEPPRIIEIEDRADDYQAAKLKRVKKALELKERELVCYDELSKALDKHADALGPTRSYTYTDANDKRKVIRYGKPKITIKAAKAERPAKKSSGNQIVSGDTNLPALE